MRDLCQNNWVLRKSQLFSTFLLSITLNAFGQAALETPTYTPVTAHQRLAWFANSTLGARALTAGAFAAGFGTARDAPHEYGPHWQGLGERCGMRLTGVSTGNAMEASLGAFWGEDPRYFRVASLSFKSRVRHVVLTTFTAPRHDGHFAPAYARYLATAGNNFLANTWRPDSEAKTSNAVTRTLWGFVGRMGSSAFMEFWPDVQARIFRTKQR